MQSPSILSKKNSLPGTQSNYIMNEVVTDPDYLVQIMQDWYIHTANTAHPQMEILPDFIADLHLKLPQVNQEHQDMLNEQITEADMEKAINDAHENSVPGQTFYFQLFASR